MDIADTLNRLIPSDQLDDSLITGQNLECQATNELQPGQEMEESLRNMLSDKDPMFGCASSQFNMLDNEESTFPNTSATGLDASSAPTIPSSELKTEGTTDDKCPGEKQNNHSHNSVVVQSGTPKPATTSTNTMVRRRPRGRPASRAQKSFLIEEGVKGVQLKKYLIQGGRINVTDFRCGLWMSPTVELRRLTVTIGGFRIELLPGPSYTETVVTSDSVASAVGFAVLPGDTVSVKTLMSENVAGIAATKKSAVDDAALGLAPYVNPNDVQASNGTPKKSPGAHAAKIDNQSVPEKHGRVTEEKEDVKQPRCNENNKTSVSKTDGKEKQHVEDAHLLKPQQQLASNKTKDLVSCKPSSTNKEHKVLPNSPTKILQRAELPKMKSLKDKKDIGALKRPAENAPSGRVTKVQKVQGTGDGKVKPKLPNSPSALVKKSPSFGNRAGDPQTPTKLAAPPHGAKVEAPPSPACRPSQAPKTPDDGGQEKAKLKKPEKILQRQKSKNAKSISVDEPQLFIPDNAPVVKKEAAEEQCVNSDSVWDGNNCCGLCKKHHNNTFMVGCGRCDDWFHGDCVGLDLAKVGEMEEEDEMYVCLKCCDEESRRAEAESLCAAKPEVQADQKLPPQPTAGPSQILASGVVRPGGKDPERRLSAEAHYRTGARLKHKASKKPVSVEAIRRSVRDTLKEILVQRLKQSDLNTSVERASEVAKKTERELFHLYKDTDNKYKNKYRSLMFNLKDTKNNVLFKRVLKGEISPGNLIRMSPEELASKELAAWRQRENRHTIEMIEKEQREAERRPITKITHKGEIEIESQEPVKAPEPMEIESPPKVKEVSAEPPESPEKDEDSAKSEKDTTNQHKTHLFDLHCKICTGRMAPPVEEAPTKVVKVATAVVRRQSARSDETKGAVASSPDGDPHLSVLEESFKNTGYETRSEHGAGRDEESSFLSNLKCLWRGFIHMHSVARLMTKTFPVSGTLDSLTEDLPDNIEVGGRISPQIVWDYLEKIRASGTKEVCLIRFSPETDEDEISYTLLYAYFSSRRRFGVVSNNRKQVKDMYLIPLGAAEKVPHHLVPFDGPGLENNRPNLLLGLLIRQRSKRDFLPVDVNETGKIIPETKPVAVSAQEARATEEEEKLFLSSLTATLKKEEKPLNAAEEVEEPVPEAFGEPSASETNNPDSHKPLRFLPGVLLGWGGELPPLPDVGATATTTTAAAAADAAVKADPAKLKSPTAASQRERFVIKKKEPKPVKSEPPPPGPAPAPAASSSSGKDDGVAAATHAAQISLRDKPPDVSTEAFLSGLPPPAVDETAAPADKSDGGPLTEGQQGAPEVNPAPQSKSPAAPDPSSGSKPPLSGILKKSSAYSAVAEEPAGPQPDKAKHPAPLSPRPVPALGSPQVHQGPLQLSQAKSRGQAATPHKKADASAAHVVHPPAVQGPQAPPAHNSAPAFPPRQPQPPDAYAAFSSPTARDQDHGTAWARRSPPPEAHEQPPALPAARDTKRLEERYSDPWERPQRKPEDRDQHRGRRGDHRDKKSRHHERERKRERSHSGDKHRERERSRHRGHSGDRHGDKRKERHHSEEGGGRHKERHRHRRDSDYDNGRRSSKDSYS